MSVRVSLPTISHARSLSRSWWRTSRAPTATSASRLPPRVRPDGYTILVAPDPSAATRTSTSRRSMPCRNSCRSSSSPASPSCWRRIPPSALPRLPNWSLSPGSSRDCATRPEAATGRTSILTAQWFASIAGVKLEQVPYRGGAPAINDLIAGHIKLGSLGSTPLIPHYKAGILAAAGANHAGALAELAGRADLSASGHRGLVLDQWLGVFVPAATPPAIVAPQCRDQQGAGGGSDPRKLPAIRARAGRRQCRAVSPAGSRRFRQVCAAGEGAEHQGQLGAPDGMG